MQILQHSPYLKRRKIVLIHLKMRPSWIAVSLVMVRAGSRVGILDGKDAWLTFEGINPHADQRRFHGYIIISIRVDLRKSVP